MSTPTPEVTRSNAGDSASGASSLKRKRSPSSSNDNLLIAAATSKTTKATNSFSINYLARTSNEDLPLINKDETVPNLLFLLSQYSNVLDRHESLASNLGARPLGPILIKRFERCFDAPPKIVATHTNAKHGLAGQEDAAQHITWLEVIEFARSHPAQFTLSTFSEGRRVCQFYYPQKQLRVQISEEDFLFINSGRCQELIPPLPIWEDEEKEVSTCDVLESKLKELTNAADMVAARTRQLSHRIKGRRAAILERRAEGGSGTPAKAGSQAGFTAVNNADPKSVGDHVSNESLTNKRIELLRHFESLPQNQQRPASYRDDEYAALVHAPDHTRSAQMRSLSPITTTVTGNGDKRSAHDTMNVPQRHLSTTLPGTTSSKHNFSRPLPAAMESSQPFRPLCQANMDSLPRGQRVLPPCDRCRRLRMDCVKNLTSCSGCTKKHARCHWKDVTREEMNTIDHQLDSAYTSHSPISDERDTPRNDNRNSEEPIVDTDDEDNPIQDLEALREAQDHRREFGVQIEERSGDLASAQRLPPDEVKTPPESHRANSIAIAANHQSAAGSASVANLLNRTADSQTTFLKGGSIGSFRAVNDFAQPEVHGNA